MLLLRWERNMEEIYNTELWSKLSKNAAFSSKYEEIFNRCTNRNNFYSSEHSVNILIRDNKLIMSYKTPVIDRELNCQQMSDTQYEFSLDDDNNLIINELSGTLRSNYGSSFNQSDGGVLDTHYSCEVYDKDGIELAYQSYSDTLIINRNTYDMYKGGIMGVLSYAYNPKLINYANSIGVYPHADIIGENPRFVRRIRSENDLGIVISTSCQFEKNGAVANPKEAYFFNTFLSHQASVHPEQISIIREYPFATVDTENKMHFNEIYINTGLTSKNYHQVAKERFLKELKEEKEQNGRHAPSTVMDKYDLMINKLEGLDKTDTRTR